jgi:hypothetical protein
MGGKRVEPEGHYEVRDHASVTGLVVIWWKPSDGPPSPTNMTLGLDRVPLLAEALADWELRHVELPEHEPPHSLRVVREDGQL